MKKEVHLIIQGKGGVGKSFVSSLLTQFFIDRGLNVEGYDTDPINRTYARINGLPVRTVNILDDDKKIDAAQFDDFISSLITTDAPVVVVDNGAATFAPLLQYLTESDAFSVLREFNITIMLHAPITGGQGQQDTINGLTELLERWPDNVMVWLNQHFGEIKDGDKSFIDFPVFQKYYDRIFGVVNLPQRNPDTFGADLRQMTSNNLTFAAALESNDFSVMPKHRLKMMRDQVYEQLLHFLGDYEQ